MCLWSKKHWSDYGGQLLTSERAFDIVRMVLVDAWRPSKRNGFREAHDGESQVCTVKLVEANLTKTSCSGLGLNLGNKFVDLIIPIHYQSS